MWATFFLAWAVCLVLLYLPGALLSRALGASRLVALAAAPPVAVVAYEALCIVYSRVQVPANGFTVVLPIALTALVACLVSAVMRHRLSAASPKRPAMSKGDWAYLAAYVLFSTVVAGLIFVGNLDGPASFPQDSDNSAHLAWVKSFVDSGNMSTLNVSFYHDLASRDLTLVSSSGVYYPAGWHMLCALVAQVSGAPVAVAVNAVNFALLAVVVPSGLFLFFRKIFQGDRILLGCGALVCLAFPSFPWGLVLPPQGPLYPNFASFALLPFAIWAFVELCSCGGRPKRLVAYAVYFVTASAAVGIMHPNGVFSLFAMLAIYVIVNGPRWLFGRLRQQGCAVARSAILGAALCAVLVLAAGALWMLLLQVPSIGRIAGFSWAAYLTPEKALVRIADLAFGRPNPQIVLPFIVLIGAVCALRRRRHLWLVVAFAFFCGSFFAAAATNGPLDALLTGFWYTDGNRVAANAGLMGIPLAALGLGCIVRAVSGLLHRSHRFIVLGNVQRKAVAGMLVIAGALLFSYLNFSRCLFGIYTAFDDIENCFSAANNQERANTFSPEERAFTAKVKEVVDSDDLILNVADDGSSFAYVTDDLNLVYRRSSNSRTGNDDAALLRNSLNELGSSAEVRDVLARNGIKYIMLLDQGGAIQDERCYYGYYNPEDWKGYNAITDETPGLEVVLAEGDMRLYRVVDGQ